MAVGEAEQHAQEQKVRGRVVQQAGTYSPTSARGTTQTGCQNSRTRSRRLDEGKRRRQERLRHQQEDLERRKRAFDAMTSKEEDARLKAVKEQEEDLRHYTLYGSQALAGDSTKGRKRGVSPPTVGGEQRPKSRRRDCERKWSREQWSTLGFRPTVWYYSTQHTCT